MKGFTRVITPLAIGLGLAGCTGSTDPTTATVFDNIQNLSSGEYDRQIAAGEAQAAALVRQNQAREQELAALEQQRARNAGTITSLQREVAAVRGQAASTRAMLERDPAGNAARLAQLGRLEAQIDSVGSDAGAGVDPAVVRSELGRISSAIRALAG